MSRETVNTICKTLPSAEVSDPWGGGHDAWKIGGKMFASIGARGDGVAVKCASVEEALHLEDLFGWPKAPYFHRSWAFLPLNTDEAELRHRIKTSYGIVRTSLTKKAQAALGQWPL
ncbi:MmcQ/YjbR family DNA-binding protein [Octadecabacter sp. 1_MG-2023]|uniref:MmcQ/YjbR family DNA-binding protein n=1 Tax=unclassified Octadecabacter TaxID=196158 RepID=UPI001C091C70|nr:MULTISPECIES: MmcQ/YjbR family DNA-binding protein [unclassified Octadecabacter]MBU2993409.1 MmcQ/YjbR family DNA-binding protein [Octadecabacter sp. B2R22]MDO6733135.1 MmcQ/YjbR family DNA-binding protein [Octadecabacter sp. 1_MG-2023]